MRENEREIVVNIRSRQNDWQPEDVSQAVCEYFKRNGNAVRFEDSTRGLTIVVHARDMELVLDR